MAQPITGIPGFTGPDTPAESDLYRCVHCGLCLSSCPTYVETALEMESPRGRLALMKAVNEERISITPTVERLVRIAMARPRKRAGYSSPIMMTARAYSAVRKIRAKN